LRKEENLIICTNEFTFKFGYDLDMIKNSTDYLGGGFYILSDFPKPKNLFISMFEKKKSSLFLTPLKQ